MNPITYSIALLVAAVAASQTSAKPDTGSQDVPQLGEIKTFKDWAVGCDNGGDCQAISLVAQESNFNDWGGPITVTRTGGTSDVLKVRVLVEAMGMDRYQMIVDGELVDTGPIVKGDNPIEIVGEDAKKVADAIARGRNLVVKGPNDQSLTEISLAGSTAAMRYMDARQNRDRTGTALIVKGRRDYKPATSEIPQIMVDQWEPAERIPATTEIIELIENSPCKDERYGVIEDQIFPMGKRGDKHRALVLVSCGSGAYNFASTPYIGEISGDEKDGASWSFTPAQFDLRPGWGGEGNDYPLLINAYWDEKDQILGSYNKGRGLGDCGSAERYIWDGESFRLVEASKMDECRGAYEWITTWRAGYNKPSVQSANAPKVAVPASENISPEGNP